jgi:DNA-binding NtrC family response regulator
MDKILIISNKCTGHSSLGQLLKEYEVRSAFCGPDTLRHATDASVRLMLLDMQLSGPEGLELLQALKHRRPDQPVILISACDSAEIMIRTAALGAEEYLVKPFPQTKLKQLIADTLQRWKVPPIVPVSPLKPFDPGAVPILGQSQAMQEIYKMIGKSAGHDMTLLITGESGTGKELILRLRR